jgi:hypothetical protein
MAMDRCATLGRSDLAKFVWAVLGAVVGCFLAKRCKGMFLFSSDPAGLVGIEPVVTDHLHSFVGYVLRKNSQKIDWVEDLKIAVDLWACPFGTGAEQAVGKVFDGRFGVNCVQRGKVGIQTPN